MNSCPIFPADWDLPTVLRIRLGHGPGRQRVIDADDHLLLVLHEVPKSHQLERVGQLFWRQPDGDWLCSIPGAGPAGVEQHLQTYADAIDRLTEEVEAACTSEACFKILGQLSPLARASRNMYTALQEARKLCSEDHELLEWRNKAYDLSRRVELLQSDAKTSLDFEVAHQAEILADASHQMATSAHRLNVLAAFFFPLATLAAVLGANLQNVLPGVSHRASLVIVLAIGLSLGGGLTHLITRPAKRLDQKQGDHE